MATQQRAIVKKPQGKVIIRQSNINLADYPALQKIERDQALIDYIFSKMEDGVDYGTEPGILKPFLHKPGAERLALAFGLTIEIEDIDDSRPDEELYRHKIITRAFAFNKDIGMREQIGMGTGICSSKESKYRYRWVGEKEIPSDMKIGMFSVIKNGTADQKEVLDVQKWVDANGIGSAKITNYGARFRVENPDIADLDNTIIKMAVKRAYSDVVQRVTGADRVFSRGEETQDAATAQQLEDQHLDAPVLPQPKPAEIEKAEPKAEPKAETKPAATSKETDDAKFRKDVIEYCGQLGFTKEGGHLNKIMERYPNCKGPMDLSAYQRKDLLNHLMDLVAHKQGELM